MILTRRTDTAASSAGTDGDYATLNSDSLGHAWVREGFAPDYEDNTANVAWTHHRAITDSTGAVSVDFSAALEASSVTKASAGRLYKATGRIDSTGASATYYIQFYNASSLPADGAVTFLIAPIKIIHTTGANSTFDVDFGTLGVYASTGMVMALSSTEFTKTISSALLSSTILYA
jgi:hypothetical protein